MKATIEFDEIATFLKKAKPWVGLAANFVVSLGTTALLASYANMLTYKGPLSKLAASVTCAAIGNIAGKAAQDMADETIDSLVEATELVVL